MKLNKRLVLFASPDITRGVFESHVISFLEGIKKEYDAPMSLIAYSPGHPTIEQKIIIKGRMQYLKDVLGVIDTLLLKGRKVGLLRSQYRKILDFLCAYNNQDLILFCQNYYAAYIGSLVKKKRKNIHFHVDLKGVVPEESLFYGENNFLINILNYLGSKYFEKKFLHSGDTFSVVSGEFKKYLQHTHGVKKEIIVFPSVVNTKTFFFNQAVRDNYRKKLNLSEGDVLITYSGSFQKWQNPDKIFELFQCFQDLSDRYKFLVLTYDKEKADTCATKWQIRPESFHSITCPASEVNGYLNASDTCVLVRKKDLINRVASPTKVPEYAVTRNTIVMTDGIGDFSGLMENKNFGVVIDSMDKASLMKAARTCEKKAPPDNHEINLFQQAYSIESNIVKFKKLFHS